MKFLYFLNLTTHNYYKTYAKKGYISKNIMGEGNNMRNKPEEREIVGRVAVVEKVEMARCWNQKRK